MSSRQTLKKRGNVKIFRNREREKHSTFKIQIRKEDFKKESHIRYVRVIFSQKRHFGNKSFSNNYKFIVDGLNANLGHFFCIKMYIFGLEQKKTLSRLLPIVQADFGLISH